MLSKRLSKVLEYIENSDKIVDVGCDHGYLAKEALLKGVKLVQLVDNKKMPLQRAIQNLRDYPEQEKIVYTLASGLTEVHDQINVACICGMGGDLISNIINDSISTSSSLDKLILQPNSKCDHLRKYLNDHSFAIIDEEIVFENEKFYQIIVAKKVKFVDKLTDLQIKYGPVLIEKHNSLLRKYLQFRLQAINEIFESNAGNQPIVKLIKEKNEIMEILYNENNENN